MSFYNNPEIFAHSPEFLAKYGRTPAWQKQGETNPDGWATATQAGIETGLVDTNYTLQPVFTREGKAIPGYRAVHRGDVPKTKYSGGIVGEEPISIVGDQYHLITPRRVCEVLDGFCDPKLNGGFPRPIETMGLRKRGLDMLVVAHVGHVDLFGLETERTMLKLFISQTFKGGSALKVGLTPVTYTCANMWDLGSSRSQFLSNITHTKDADSVFQMAMEINDALVKQQADALTLFNRLQSRQIDEEQVIKVLEQVWPNPEVSKKARRLHESAQEHTVSANLMDGAMIRHDVATYAWEHAAARMLERRRFALSIYERMLDDRQTGPTLYTLAGALIEATERHMEGRRGDPAEQLVSPTGERRKEKRHALKTVFDVLDGKNRQN